MACITNGAYIDAARDQADAIFNQALADTAIYAALALWQRNTSSSIANMQNEIANRQIKLAEQLHDHAKKFWDAEISLVNDAFGETKYNPQYAATSLQWGDIVDTTMRQARTDWLDTTRSWCLAPDLCDDARWQRNAQVARADLMSYADRQEEARAQIINDRRYARRYGVLGLGRDRLQSVPSFQQIGGTLGANAAGMLVGTINSALEAFGYYPARNAPERWGEGIRQTFEARAPYSTGQTNTPSVQVMPVSLPPIAEPRPLEPSQAQSPCGPMPQAGASNEEWDRWNNCMGYK